MKNLKIEFAQSGEIFDVAKLSAKFEREECCNGIVADNQDYFSDKKVAVAKIDNTIVGYCYGKFEMKEKDTSKFKKGQKSFYLEELYIDKSFRNQEIGRTLYRFIESYAIENGCDWIETTAVSKNYKSLLSFYIDVLGMEFWSAEMIKTLKNEQ